MSERKVLSVEEILLDLENGLTRKPNSAGYDPIIGSISGKYSLTSQEISILFNHPSLKGKKTKKPFELLIVDTITEKESILNKIEEHEEISNNLQVSELVKEEEEVEIEELEEEVEELKVEEEEEINEPELVEDASETREINF